MEGVLATVSANLGWIAVAALVAAAVVGLIQKYTRYDVLAPTLQFGGMALVLGLTAVAYIYGGWMGLGFLALLIVLR